MTNEFSYKNLSLSVTTHGVYGNEIMSLERPRSTRGDFQDKQLTTANDFWISEEQPGDGNTPRPNDNTTGGIREISTRLVLPGTYFWINNITLSYEFPSKIYERLNLNALQVYVSTTNPFLFTKNNAFNPDVNNSSNPLTPGEDQNNYPIAKSINFGLRVDF